MTNEKGVWPPQIWSPEVTKSAAMVVAEELSVPRNTQGAWLLIFSSECSQFFGPSIVSVMMVRGWIFRCKSLVNLGHHRISALDRLP